MTVDFPMEVICMMVVIGCLVENLLENSVLYEFQIFLRLCGSKLTGQMRQSVRFYVVLFENYFFNSIPFTFMLRSRMILIVNCGNCYGRCNCA